MVIEDNQTQIKAAIYLRVSTEDQKERFGLEMQRATVEAIIKTKGVLDDNRPRMILAGENYVYVDDGISGTTPINERPAFSRLIEDLVNAGENKPFDVVLVYKIDRFARKLTILLEISDFLAKNKVEFISALESIDTSNSFGRAMLGIMGVIAELEREVILERTQSGLEVAKNKGSVAGKQPPYGYIRGEDKKLIILPSEEKIVQRIYELFSVHKYTYQQIADLLQEEMIESPEDSAIKNNKRQGDSNKKNSIFFWRAEQVKKILTNEIYTGSYYFNKTKKGKKLAKDEWTLSEYSQPAIIPFHLFELVQLRVADLKERKINHQPNTNEYLLGSLLQCKYCESLDQNKLLTKNQSFGWTGVKHKNKAKTEYIYYYQCNRKNRKKFDTVCPVIPIPAKQIEEYVTQFILNLLKDPTAVYKHYGDLNSTKLAKDKLQDDIKQYKKLLDGIPAQIARNEEALLHGVYSAEKAQAYKEQIIKKQLDYENKIIEIDKQLSDFILQDGYLDVFEQFKTKYKDFLQSADREPKLLKELIGSIVDKIVIHARPRNEDDKIAGQKKDNQMIPNGIDIQIKLPQSMLNNLLDSGFTVENDKWWVGRDSNPRPTA